MSLGRDYNKLQSLEELLRLVIHNPNINDDELKLIRHTLLSLHLKHLESEVKRLSKELDEPIRR